MFVNSNMGGMNFAFPDVCLTPAGPAVVPTPYPNIGMPMSGTPSVNNVLIECMPAQNLLTEIPVTSGDEAGSATGVASGMIVGPCKYLMGSAKLILGSAPAVRLTSQTMQNSTNAPGATQAPSQTKVIALG